MLISVSELILKTIFARENASGFYMYQYKLKPTNFGDNYTQSHS